MSLQLSAILCCDGTSHCSHPLIIFSMNSLLPYLASSQGLSKKTTCKLRALERAAPLFEVVGLEPIGSKGDLPSCQLDSITCMPNHAKPAADLDVIHIFLAVLIFFGFSEAAFLCLRLSCSLLHQISICLQQLPCLYHP